MNNASAHQVFSKDRALHYYKWGNNCEAWSFVDTNQLSVKLENMPTGAEEELHYHREAQQFFQIIKGAAVFEVDDVITIVREGEGIHIQAGQKHRVTNKEEETLEFLVCSQPSTKSD